VTLNGRLNGLERGVEKHYASLDPWKRTALGINARLRGDEAEERKLAASAPKLNGAVCHNYGLSVGIERLVFVLHMQRLADAMLYWRSEGLLHLAPILGETEKFKGYEPHMLHVMRMTCDRAVGREEGWRLLCEDLGIDPDGLFNDLPGAQMVKEFIEAARSTADAFRPQLDALLKANGAVAQTPQEVAGEMREFLDQQLAGWSRETHEG